jgi:hypothetical protein
MDFFWGMMKIYLLVRYMYMFPYSGLRPGEISSLLSLGYPASHALEHQAAAGQGSAAFVPHGMHD